MEEAGILETFFWILLALFVAELLLILAEIIFENKMNAVLHSSIREGIRHYYDDLDFKNILDFVQEKPAPGTASPLRGTAPSLPQPPRETAFLFIANPCLQKQTGFGETPTRSPEGPARPVAAKFPFAAREGRRRKRRGVSGVFCFRSLSLARFSVGRQAPGEVINTLCGYRTLGKERLELLEVIHVRGCVHAVGIKFRLAVAFNLARSPAAVSLLAATVASFYGKHRVIGLVMARLYWQKLDDIYSELETVDFKGLELRDFSLELLDLTGAGWCWCLPKEGGYVPVGAAGEEDEEEEGAGCQSQV
nr:PREDICTED: tetraspanin-15-like [Struthio camelus australis]